MSNSCVSCKHYHKFEEIESWEMPHIFEIIRICDAKPTIVNLKQFPFRNAKCVKYEREVTR